MYSDYDVHREATAERYRKMSKSGRDIAGGWPGDGNLERRESCRFDLALFFRTYFPAAFSLPFSPDHDRVIAVLQKAVLEGGLFAMAMPRGYGKTTICQRAMIWATIYSHRRFGCIIGATERDSRATLRDIRTELLHNDLLGEDFPEVCYPFRATGGQARMCGGQLWEGEQTLISMAQDELVFGTIPPADETGASGNVITVRAITGAIRGQHHDLKDGSVIRPEFVLLDDPQTRESAKSLMASNDREKIILGDVLGLGGNTVNVTAAMTCTVIYKGDVADRFLDRSKHPEWQGVRTKMVYSFPTNEQRWDEYRNIYTSSLGETGDVAPANDFYHKHQDEMDAGATIAWPESYPENCLSAVQYAMNLKFLDLTAFMSERQNEPEELAEDEPILTQEIVLGKVNKLKRLVAPMSAQHATAFIDVHARLLYYMVAAWADDFTGQIVTYGTYPDQTLLYFAQATAPRFMEQLLPGATDDAWIQAGLETLADKLLSTVIKREDGVELKVERLLIDAHWSEKTELVKTFCRRHKDYGTILYPSFGVGLGARSLPWEMYKVKEGTKTGLRWRIVPESTGWRHVTIDVNFWKSFVSARVAMPLGTRGGIELFSAPKGHHTLIADHWCSEKPVKVTAKGREVTEWEWTPSQGDNHWFDCLVGCAVGASMQGVKPPGVEHRRERKPRMTAAQVAALANRR